eukprot:4938402-Amphidinium_carterae.2
MSQGFQGPYERASFTRDNNAPNTVLSLMACLVSDPPTTGRLAEAYEHHLASSLDCAPYSGLHEPCVEGHFQEGVGKTEDSDACGHTQDRSGVQGAGLAVSAPGAQDDTAAHSHPHPMTSRELFS